MHTIYSLLSDKTLSKKSILEKLILHRCGLTKEELFQDTDKIINKTDYNRIKDAYTAYMQDDQPLEYILGWVEFLGVRFKVNSDTLIPRPETEYMITAVNERISQPGNDCTTLFDIGTGCGVLGISTLYHNPNQINQAYLTDISEDALAVARQNYINIVSSENQTKVDFFTANILDDARLHEGRKSRRTSNKILLIVANLPYIPEQLFDENTDQSVKKREPKFAFVGGDDGLYWYRVQFDQMLELQKYNPISCTQFLEMMTWQVEILRKEYGEYFVFEEVKTFHFNIRIVKVTRK